MGVRRLKTFIRRYPVQQLRDFELHNATVVIDGSELFYTLYFDHDSGRRGGEYSSFRMVINEFFDTLVNRCNIQCYVVFDRFKSENHIERYLSKRTEKLQYVTQMINGEVMERGLKAQPCMGRDVLKQTLHELSVPYIVVPGDGDAELAAIANNLDAYVLATDTDFCVFQLSRGFIQLDNFYWRNATDRCRCKIFHQRTLVDTFRIPTGAIAFLEPLLSNQEDLHVDFSSLFQAISKYRRHFPRNQQRSNTTYWRPDEESRVLQSVLIWLGREYNNDDSTIGYIRQLVPNLPEDAFRRCLDMYRNQPDDVESFVDELRDGGHSFGALTQCFNFVGETDDPADFLPILPDDQDRPSCNKMSSSIRYAIYQMGIMKGEASGAADQYDILVTDRNGRIYAAEFINVTVDRNALETLHVEVDEEALRRRDDMHDVMRSRENFILDILSRGEDHSFVDNFSNETKLLASVFQYWSSSTVDDQRHSDETIKALAFTLSATYHDGEPDLIAEIANMQNDVFDIAALHSSSQWLCCVKDATTLNVVLGKPLECIVMGRLFSGILYQKAFSYFVSRDDADDEEAAAIFQNHAVAQAFYESLLNLSQ